MIAVHNFRQSEFRERVTEAILEMLADLPETHRDIFIWSHYRGYQPRQIAEILKCSRSEVEATLEAITSILYQRTRSLVEEDPQRGAGTNLPADLHGLAGGKTDLDSEVLDEAIKATGSVVMGRRIFTLGVPKGNVPAISTAASHSRCAVTSVVV